VEDVSNTCYLMNNYINLITDILHMSWELFRVVIPNTKFRCREDSNWNKYIKIKMTSFLLSFLASFYLFSFFLSSFISLSFLHMFILSTQTGGCILGLRFHPSSFLFSSHFVFSCYFFLYSLSSFSTYVPLFLIFKWE
jgi:hypothetical protein